MRARGRHDPPPRRPDDFVAAEDADTLAARAIAQIERANESDWYEAPGSDADRAALTLCRLRRAQAGLAGEPRRGDQAVRAALEAASPEAVVWIASRAISYLDETGFPDAVEPWFPDDASPR